MVEQEITLPPPTLFGVEVPHEVKIKIEIISVEITVIGNPHLFLQVPWL
jgi:hypothetical protein